MAHESKMQTILRTTLELAKAHGRPVRLHEVSRFVREHSRWQYLDGRIIPADRPAARVKTGRNDPCPCGSGRKYKKCCGR